jgi:hypothetical protein
MDSRAPGQDPITKFCEHGHGSLGFINGGKFLYQQGDPQLRKKTYRIVTYSHRPHDAFYIQHHKKHT